MHAISVFLSGTQVTTEVEECVTADTIFYAFIQLDSHSSANIKKQM
jgi:hypothetical protein